MVINVLTASKVIDYREKFLKAISSSTRLSILKHLSEGDKHISGLARDIGISVPVTAKHIKILENVDILERKKVGNMHLISIKLNKVYSFLDHFAENRKLEVEQGTTLLEALRSVAAIEVEKVGDRIKVISTDGEEGFYVYELDGKFSDKTVSEYTFSSDVVVEWKKLIPVTKKRLLVNIKRQTP